MIKFIAFLHNFAKNEKNHAKIFELTEFTGNFVKFIYNGYMIICIGYYLFWILWVKVIHEIQQI